MARGYQQENGHDYNEKFIDLAHMTIVPTLLVMASIRRWFVSQLDVTNTFLHGEL